MLTGPPRAIWPMVVANESEMFSWNMCPPARFSIATPPWLTPGRKPDRRGLNSMTTETVERMRNRPPRPTITVSFGVAVTAVSGCILEWRTHVGSMYTAARSPSVLDTIAATAGEY